MLWGWSSWSHTRELSSRLESIERQSFEVGSERTKEDKKLLRVLTLTPTHQLSAIQHLYHLHIFAIQYSDYILFILFWELLTPFLPVFGVSEFQILSCISRWPNKSVKKIPFLLPFRLLPSFLIPSIFKAQRSDLWKSSFQDEDAFHRLPFNLIRDRTSFSTFDHYPLRSL